MRSRSLIVLATITALVLVAACGGGDDDPGVTSPTLTTAEDDPEAVQAARKVAEAIQKPGMVYHLVGDDGSEVWADATAARFRRRDADLSGGLTAVGEGWTRFYYDARSNETAEEDLQPTGSEPRINHPMIAWIEPLSALAYGRELRYEGETESNGRRVLVLTARSPVASQGQVTGYLEGRIEVDPVTYLPVALERSQVDSSGAPVTPGTTIEGIDPNQRVTYTVSELVPRDSLPADLFDRAVVEAQVQTLESEIARIRASGLTPFWLGKDYSSDRGFLSLPDRQGVSASSAAGEGEFQYALIIPTSPTSGEPSLGSVVVRLGSDPAAFGPPPIQQFGGTLPERRQETTVRGVPAVVYTSVLTPSDLPCQGDGCVKTDAPLFTRIVFVDGGTAVQIETSARVDANGEDRNRYNSVEGIIALAEALTEAQ